MGVGINYTKTRPKIPSNIFHKQRDSLHLLLHPDKPYWLVVNNLGREIVKLCDGRHDVEEIGSILARRYRREPAEVQSDIESYLDHLTRTHFLLNEGPESVEEPKTSLKRLQLNIVEVCNLKCIHCGVLDGAPKNEGLKKAKVFDMIDELSKDDGAAIAISGGEPLLHKGCLEILEYASKRLKTSLSTNATLIDERTARSLSFLDIDLQISLDGSTPSIHDRIRGDGTFDKAMEGIRLLKKYGATERIALFVTVMKQNIDSIPRVIRFAEEMGIPSVSFLPVQRLGTAGASWDDISPTPKEYNDLYTYLYQKLPPTSINISGGFQGFVFEVSDGETWCRLGETLFIDSSGAIYPCSLMAHPDFYIGNIHVMSLKEALESDRLREIIKICGSREENIKKCKDCSWKNFCQACCPGSVFFQKGTLWDTDDLCNLRQRLYPEVIFDMAEKRVDIPLTRQTVEC